jgi:hypothetical protein
MKKNIIYIVLFALISGSSFAQGGSDSTVVKEKDYPVDAVFESGYLIDAQTTVIPEVKTMEMVIQHKFGSIDDGISNLYGIYGSSNIRLGMNYVPIKNLQIGAGITKRYMMTDINAKYTILQQTRKNTMPISLTVYGNVGIDGSDIGSLDSIQEGSYTGPIGPYTFADRLSYFSQVIVSRKFCKEFSMQAGLSFTHYNAVKPEYDHDKLGAHVSGRVKVSPMGSIIFNFDAPLNIAGMSEHKEFTNPPKPSVAFGYEVSTGTHAFQFFLASTQSLLPQDNMMWNQNEMNAEGFSFGFVITRLWAH